MSDGTAYRDVILRIKVEADQGLERSLQSIGSQADNAIRTVERNLINALQNIEAMIKRLAAATASVGTINVGGGGGIGQPIGGSGNATYGYNRREPMILGGGVAPRGGDAMAELDAWWAAQTAPIDARLKRLREAQNAPPTASPIFGVGMGMIGALAGTELVRGAYNFYEDAGRLKFDQHGVPTPSALAGFLGGGNAWGDMTGGRSLLSSVNLTEAVAKTGRLDSRWRQIGLQEVRQQVEAEGARATAELGGDYAFARAMNQGTSQGQLDALRGSMGSASNDQQRIRFREQELQLTRQIAQEQTRGAQVALRALEREKQHLEEALALRQRQVNATGESLGFSGTRNMQLTLGAAEKLASGQGGSLTDEEVQALQGIRGIGGTLPGLLEEEGNRRAAPVLGRIKELFGVNKELADKQAAIDKVQGEVTAKQELIIKVEKDQTAIEQTIRAAINEAMAQMESVQQAKIRAMVKQSIEEAAKTGPEARSAAARSSGTRFGLKH